MLVLRTSAGIRCLEPTRASIRLFRRRVTPRPKKAAFFLVAELLATVRSVGPSLIAADVIAEQVGAILEAACTGHGLPLGEAVRTNQTTYRLGRAAKAQIDRGP